MPRLPWRAGPSAAGRADRPSVVDRAAEPVGSVREAVTCGRRGQRVLGSRVPVLLFGSTSVLDSQSTLFSSVPHYTRSRARAKGSICCNAALAHWLQIPGSASRLSALHSAMPLSLQSAPCNVTTPDEFPVCSNMHLRPRTSI